MKNFLNKKPTIKFASSLNVYTDTIKKSSTTVPDWYKNAEKWFGGKINIGADNATFKICAPFLDAMVAGYTMVLPKDVLVTQTHDGPNISWRSDETLVTVRDPKKSGELPTPSGYHDDHFAWKNFTSFGVPEGYCFLFTHPLNHFELPFFTLSGVVDGNFIMNHGGNIPFFLKKGFEGIIEQGTPIAQIIPFKNEKWNIEQDKSLLEEGDKNYSKSMALISGWYKKEHWRKKIW